MGYLRYAWMLFLFFFFLMLFKFPAWEEWRDWRWRYPVQPWLCMSPAQGCSKANLNYCFKSVQPQLSLGEGEDLMGLPLPRLPPVQQHFAFCLLLSEHSHACGLAECWGGMGGHPSLALACPAGSSVVWAVSLGTVGHSGGWWSAVGVAQLGPIAGSHEHKPAAVQQLYLLRLCLGVGCMKSCVPYGWEGLFSPCLSARCFWQPSPCLLHLPVTAKDVSTMGSMSYIEQVAVSINILSPLHSQAVGKCTERRTGWIHVNVNLQSRTPPTNVLLNHSHFRPRQSPSL